jgi:hypothetical protein
MNNNYINNKNNQGDREPWQIKDFAVKNGIVVNTSFSANSSGIYFSNTLLANSTQVNAATFTGTANNTSFVGSVSAANVVSNAQLSSNLANYVTTTNLTNNLSNYQTTAGLSANVSTLTANNTSFVGSVSAANVVSNAQLSANLGNYVTTTNLTNNLSNYQTTAGLNANIASYLPTYSGVVNGSTFSVGSSWTANTTRVVFGTTVGLQANGSIGSANQALFSNGTTVYWANVSGGAGYYKGNQGAAGSPSNANNLFRINSNTMSNNITISAGENALTTGPITVNTGITLTIDTGGRAVII